MSFLERRSFVKKLMGGAACIASAAYVPLSLQLKNNYNDPEDYWKSIRKSFPLQKVKVYLNNGTFGPSPLPVLQNVRQSLEYAAETGDYGNTHSVRLEIAKFFNTTQEQICLTHNTTEGINIAAQGLPLKAGDEVLITLQEHVGNALPWLNVQRRKGIVLKPFNPAGTQQEVIQQIKSLITDKVKVIAVPHITCTTGQVLPVHEICMVAREAGITTVIDGAHGAGTFELNLDALGCDVYASCFHKWMLGPAGTGFLFLHKNFIEKLDPLFVGAYSDQGWILSAEESKINSFVNTAHRFDYGTQSSALYSGAAESVRFISQIGQKKITERIKSLSDSLYEKLDKMQDRLTLLTPRENASRISMVTFKPKRIGYIDFGNLAAKEGFRVRVVPESKLDAIRVSTHFYNSFEEIDQFIQLCEKNL